jgi:hypothetical protein
MATTIEEMNLKLGIDQSNVDPGLMSFTQKVNAATEKAAAAFDKVEHSGRGFHKVLHSITEASPLLGGALQAALNPIGGTLMAATIAYAYFNKKIEEGNADLDRLGSLGKQKLGDVKEAAKDAAKEVAALSEKFSELNAKEAQARGERNTKNAFNKGLKDTEGASARSLSRLEGYHKLAGEKIDAAEQSGAVTPEQAKAQRAALGRDYDVTKRNIEIQGEQRVLKQHKDALTAEAPKAWQAEVELTKAEAAVTGKDKSGRTRQDRLKLAEADHAANAKNIADTEANLEKAREWHRSVLDREKDAGKNPFLKAKLGFELATEMNARGGFTPAGMEASYEGTLQAQRRYGAKTETEIERLTKEDKQAKDRAALARDHANKIEADVSEHDIARQDSERKLKGLGSVHGYQTLDALAKGGSSVARQLLALQARNDPRDKNQIGQLQDSLSRAQLQPSQAEAQNPLNALIKDGNAMRVHVVNTE